MIRRTATLLVALVVALAGALAVAPAASARVAPESKVTYAEYRAIDLGMTRQQVARIFGTGGSQLRLYPVGYAVFAEQGEVSVGPYEERVYPGVCGGRIVLEFYRTLTGVWRLGHIDGFIPQQCWGVRG